MLGLYWFNSTKQSDWVANGPAMSGENQLNITLKVKFKCIFYIYY
jgi:hypothetical protein